MSKRKISNVFCFSVMVFLVFSMPCDGVNDDSFLSYFNVKCYIYECCSRPWLKEDTKGLRAYLTHSVHGQHLVVDPIVRSIRGHLNNARKALALSMHGSTGTGKNYVSKAIAEYLYREGMKSQYVHLFSVTLHFPHEHLVDLYKDQLQSWIMGNTSLCHRNLFIFDEVHEMPAGVIDAILPFLEFHEQIRGQDYRNNIFLFLGNTGGMEINKYVLDQWLSGKPREDITLRDLQPVITRSAYNEHGGLWHSRLIDRSQISTFIPFLPLECNHIKKCIYDDLTWKRLPSTQLVVDSVLDELEYKPDDLKLYAKSGCKPVSDKVNLMVEVFDHDEL